MAASIRREWAIARSYRLPFLLTFAQLFGSLASFYFLGRLIGPSLDQGHGAQLRHGYFAFAVVGELLLSTVGVTLGAFSQRLRTDQTTGTLETLLVSPSPAWLSVTAGAAYELVFATLASIFSLFLAVVLFHARFEFRPGADLVAVLLVVGLLALFAALGLGFAAFVLVFKRGGGVVGLILSALALFGGAFYPISVLPAPLHDVAAFIPFAWAASGLRNALIVGGVPWARTGEVWAAAVVLVPLVGLGFGAALRRARRAGTLAQY